jgi:hypothetical protein
MSSPSDTRGRSARSWGGGARRTAPNPGKGYLVEFSDGEIVGVTDTEVEAVERPAG